MGKATDAVLKQFQKNGLEAKFERMQSEDVKFKVSTDLYLDEIGYTIHPNFYINETDATILMTVILDEHTNTMDHMNVLYACNQYNGTVNCTKAYLDDDNYSMLEGLASFNVDNIGDMAMLFLSDLVSYQNEVKTIIQALPLS